jgi:GrpB-like predicted nucleotidyltransferase (UPF0157 family)
MAHVIRTHTTVLPGQRIEVSTPDIPAGSPVEVVVTSRAEGKRRILEFLDALPPGPHSASTWEELERGLAADRDAWDS